MASPGRRTLKLALLASGTPAAVAAIWLLGGGARAIDRAPAASATQGMLFGGAPRPLRSLCFAFGAPEARAALTEGFAAAPDSGVPAPLPVVTGQRAVFSAALVPDRAGVRMTLLGRTPAPSEWSVLVNDTSAGKLRFGPDLTLARLVLPENAVVAGQNSIALTRPAAGPPLALGYAWFDAPSSFASLDVGSEAARPALLGGWGPELEEDDRSVRALTGRWGEVRTPPRPLSADYALVVTAKTSPSAAGATQIAANSGAVELARFQVGPAWTRRFARVPLGRLPRGDAKLSLARDAAFSGSVLFDRISLFPIEDRVLIDAGTPEGRAFLAEGFSFDEAFENVTAVWSLGKASRVHFVLDPAKESYVVALHAKAFPALQPLEVNVSLNGHRVGAFRAAAAFGLFELTVARWNFATGENELALEYGATAEPRSVDPRSSDARELALQIDWLELRPESRGPRLGAEPQSGAVKPR